MELVFGCEGDLLAIKRTDWASADEAGAQCTIGGMYLVLRTDSIGVVGSVYKSFRDFCHGEPPLYQESCGGVRAFTIATSLVRFANEAIAHEHLKTGAHAERARELREILETAKK